MPNPACVEPKCGGLIIRVGVHERDHRKALQLARKVVRRNLRGKWKVAPLGQRVRDFAVTRVGKRGAIGVGTAWDNVYRLANDRDVVDVEPTFDIAGLEPDPEHMARQLTSWEQVSAKSSGGGSRDKRCSTAYDWSIENCRFVKAWNVPPVGGKRFGKGIKVGHPDTGYTHHPEIWNNPLGEQRVQSGYDFVDADPSAYDPLARGNPGHGTKTGSLIMSDIGFHLGAPFITGGAPEAVLVAYRVMKSVVVVRFKNVVEAIYEAVDDGCHVISMSLGGPVAGWALPRAVRYAVDRGVILFAAAGCHDDQHTVLDRVVDGDRFDLGRVRSGEAHVDDPGTVVDGVLDRLSHVGRPGMTEVVDPFQHHDSSGGVDAGNANTVAAPGSDDAGHHRAVPVVIPGIAVPAKEVPADDIVHVAVPVVVDVVVGRLALVPPDVLRIDVEVVPVEAGIDDRHVHRLEIGACQRPGGIRTAREADLLDGPLIVGWLPPRPGGGEVGIDGGLRRCLRGGWLDRHHAQACERQDRVLRHGSLRMNASGPDEPERYLLSTSGSLQSRNGPGALSRQALFSFTSMPA